MLSMDIDYELLKQADDGQWEVIETGSMETIAGLRRDNQKHNPCVDFHIRPVRKH